MNPSGKLNPNAGCRSRQGRALRPKSQRPGAIAPGSAIRAKRGARAREPALVPSYHDGPPRVRAGADREITREVVAEAVAAWQAAGRKIPKVELPPLAAGLEWKRSGYLGAKADVHQSSEG